MTVIDSPTKYQLGLRNEFMRETFFKLFSFLLGHTVLLLSKGALEIDSSVTFIHISSFSCVFYADNEDILL